MSEKTAQRRLGLALGGGGALTRLRIAQSPPDLLIQPPIPDGILIFWGFTRAREAIAAGEESARQALPAIEKLLVHSGVGVG